MSIEIKTYLYDMLQCTDRVLSYFEDSSKVYADYLADEKTKYAVERNIEIIAEALNRIRKIDKNFHLEKTHQIIATRNRVVHAYDTISDELIWGIVINDLPKLKTEIEKLLNE